MGIDWGAAARNNNSFGYFQMGQELGQQVIDNKVGNALTAYVTNPQDQQALATITRYDPKTGMALRQQQEAAAKEAQKAELIKRAAGGDDAAMLSLWGVDYNVAKELDGASRQKAMDGIKYIASAAYQIAPLPSEAEKAAAWDSYIDRGVAMFPGLAQYKGKYSPESLNAILAQAGEMQQFQTYQQPKYTPVGEGGLAGFQFGVPIQQGGQAQNFGPSASAPPPQQAIDYLRRNPGLKAEFDAKYGAGSADRILGGAASNGGGNFPGQ